MRCPWPAVRLARTLRTAAADCGTVVLVADDPRAGDEARAVLSDLPEWFISGTEHDADGVLWLEIRRS